MLKLAQPIKLILSDVDGVMTDGCLIYNGQGEHLKVFNVLDGHGIKSLQQQGIQFGIISGRKHPAVTQRMKELGIDIVFQQVEDKLSCYQAIKQQLDLEDCEIAYIGDDEPDIPVLSLVGISATVTMAPSKVQQVAQYCCKTPAGRGALREFIDIILETQVVTHHEQIS